VLGALAAPAAMLSALLDPFSFGVDPSEKRTMATKTLRLLLPRMSEERESAMIQAVGTVAGTDRPSLGKVITHLEQSEDPAWKNTGAVMRPICEMNGIDRAAPQGHFPGRGVGDHAHARRRQAGAGGVTDGPVAEHRADPGLAERR
jgi:hypothetical protein